MIAACRAYLIDKLQGLALGTGIKPFLFAEEGGTIFFDELPVDFLKDNDYAACCLPLRDATKALGKVIAAQRTADKSARQIIRRRFTREIMFRCLLYAKSSADLWEPTPAGPALVEQMIQAVADQKLLVDSDNSAILVDPPDVARPWDSEMELERKLNRPRLAIVRVHFKGGVQTVTTQPLIKDFTLNDPAYTITINV